MKLYQSISWFWLLWNKFSWKCSCLLLFQKCFLEYSFKYIFCSFIEVLDGNFSDVSVGCFFIFFLIILTLYFHAFCGLILLLSSTSLTTFSAVAVYPCISSNSLLFCEWFYFLFPDFSQLLFYFLMKSLLNCWISAPYSCFMEKIAYLIFSHLY